MVARQSTTLSHTMTDKTTYTYKDAGVDIDAGASLVDAIKPLAKSTRRPGSDVELGGFGGFFDLKAAGYTDPILVAATDGVGTKLKVAIEANKHDTVGIDLVAMCVNDLVVQGAEPLLFLDYFATGKLSVEAGRAIVAGIAEGCRQSGSALIGGETAEMPGMYKDGDYDQAGFSVGALERGRNIPSPDLKAGDVLLGLASSGVHSNGYSLVRRLVDDKGFRYDDPCPFAPGVTLGDALLTPTRIYVKTVLPQIRNGRIKALAHITGGGLTENTPRMLRKDLCAVIDAGTWQLPPVFQWLMTLGNIPLVEMVRTFNCGVGMVAAVAAEEADALADALRTAGETVYKIGVLEAQGANSPHAGTVVRGAAGVWGATAAWDAVSQGGK